MPSPIVLVRPPASSFTRALSEHPGKSSIDISRVQEQHRAYVQALKDLGVEVRRRRVVEDVQNGFRLAHEGDGGFGVGA